MAASELSVNVEWEPGIPFGLIMDEVQTWLESQKIRPIKIDPISNNKATGFQIRFGSEKDARLFLQQFSLRFDLCEARTTYAP
jgi:hypothetical protein